MGIVERFAQRKVKALIEPKFIVKVVEELFAEVDTIMNLSYHKEDIREIIELCERAVSKVGELEQMALDFESQTRGKFPSRTVAKVEDAIGSSLHMAELITDGTSYTAEDIDRAYQEIGLRMLHARASLMTIMRDIDTVQQLNTQGLN